MDCPQKRSRHVGTAHGTSAVHGQSRGSQLHPKRLLTTSLERGVYPSEIKRSGWLVFRSLLPAHAEPHQKLRQSQKALLLLMPLNQDVALEPVGLLSACVVVCRERFSSEGAYESWRQGCCPAQVGDGPGPLVPSEDRGAQRPQRSGSHLRSLAARREDGLPAREYAVLWVGARLGV